MYIHIRIYLYMRISSTQTNIAFAQEMKNTFYSQQTEVVSGRAGQGVAEGVQRWQPCRRQHIAAGVTPMTFVFPSIYVSVCAYMARACGEGVAQGSNY